MKKDSLLNSDNRLQDEELIKVAGGDDSYSDYKFGIGARVYNYFFDTGIVRNRTHDDSNNTNYYMVEFSAGNTTFYRRCKENDLELVTGTTNNGK